MKPFILKISISGNAVGILPLFNSIFIVYISVAWNAGMIYVF